MSEWEYILRGLLWGILYIKSIMNKQSRIRLHEKSMVWKLTSGGADEIRTRDHLIDSQGC